MARDTPRHSARAFDHPDEAGTGEPVPNAARAVGAAAGDHSSAWRSVPFDLTCHATLTVAAQVRLMIGYRLHEWGLSTPKYSDMHTNLMIVISELINNAVEETPEREIRIRCVPDFTARLVRIGVWDSSMGRPKPHMPDLDLETLDLREEHLDNNGGWGLPLVQTIAENCGVNPVKIGKWVWADIKITE